MCIGTKKTIRYYEILQKTFITHISDQRARKIQLTTFILGVET